MPALDGRKLVDRNSGAACVRQRRRDHEVGNGKLVVKQVAATGKVIVENGRIPANVACSLLDRIRIGLELEDGVDALSK